MWMSLVKNHHTAKTSTFSRKTFNAPASSDIIFCGSLPVGSLNRFILCSYDNPVHDGRQMLPDPFRNRSAQKLEVGHVPAEIRMRLFFRFSRHPWQNNIGPLARMYAQSLTFRRFVFFLASLSKPNRSCCSFTRQKGQKRAIRKKIKTE